MKGASVTATAGELQIFVATTLPGDSPVYSKIGRLVGACSQIETLLDLSVIAAARLTESLGL